MKKFSLFAFIFFALFLFSSQVQAAGGGVARLMNSIERVILNPLIIFLFALAMAYFLYGVMQFIVNPGSEEMKKTGKSHMIWGVVGMAIMVSVFGIMKIIPINHKSFVVVSA